MIPRLQARRPGLPVPEPVAAGLVVALVFALMTWTFLDGLGPRDGERYLQAALAWAEDGPQLGRTHWSLRYPIVWPVAAAFEAFGASEIVASWVQAAYAALLVTVTFVFGRRFMGRRAGTLAALFCATSPFLVAQAFEIRVYGPEIAFTALALWGAIEGARRRSVPWLLLAGLSAGGAWLCRETAVYLPVLLGLASLVWFGRAALDAPRRGLPLLLATSLAFLAVAGVEMAGYWAASGDPIYRARVSTGHQAIYAGEDVEIEAQPVAPPITEPLQQNPLIEFVTTPVAGPFLILAALALLLGGRRALGTGPVAWLFGGGALLAYVVVNLLLRLEQADYVPLVSYAAVLAMGAGIAAAKPRIGRVGMAACAAGIAVAGLLAADFRDYDEYADARWLEDQVLEGEAPVTADGLTAVRSWTLLRLAGEDEASLSALVTTAPACAGRLALVTDPLGSVELIVPEDDWRLVSEQQVRRRSVARELVRMSGLAPEGGKLDRIVRRPPPLRLYEVGPSAPACLPLRGPR